jgi:hypothetical protein
MKCSLPAQIVCVLALLVSGCATPARSTATALYRSADSEGPFAPLAGVEKEDAFIVDIPVGQDAPLFEIRGEKLFLLVQTAWSGMLTTHVKKPDWIGTDVRTKLSEAAVLLLPDPSKPDGGIPWLKEKPNQALQTTSVTRTAFGNVPVSDRQRRGV